MQFTHVQVNLSYVLISMASMFFQSRMLYMCFAIINKMKSLKGANENVHSIASWGTEDNKSIMCTSSELCTDEENE